MAIRKVSLSLPEDLVREALEWSGNGNLSAYVTQGLRRQVLADRRRRYLADLDAAYGPLTEEEREEGRRLWNGEA